MKTPSKQVKCDDGRLFDLRELNPGDMLDLIEAAGSAAASDAWMRYAVMICSVEAIDGKPIMMPCSKNAIRELGRRIGNGGVAALTNELYPEAEQEAAAQSEMDSVKN